jgi:hypothetical protein
MPLRALWLLVLLAVFWGSASVRAEPKVELLTMGPGDALWERYGHAALRVRQGKSDLVYNYGIAPFTEPSFVWDLMRGRALYFIIAEPMVKTFIEYRDANRSLVSQELNLPAEEKRWLVEQLESAVRPPSNRYRYDHLYDNCSTRIRDLIDAASHGALRRAAASRKPQRTFRDDSLIALSGHFFASWGFDLMSGPHQDLRLKDGYEEMYLPEHLHDRVAEARIERNGQSVPLAGQRLSLYQRKGPPARWLHKDLHRFVLVGLSAAMGVLFFAYAARARQSSPVPMALRRATWRVLALLCGISALFGLIEIPFRIICTLHGSRYNENVWLFFPLDLFLLDPLRERIEQDKPPARWVRPYVAARLGCVAVVILLKLLSVLRQHNQVFVLFAAALKTL